VYEIQLITAKVLVLLLQIRRKAGLTMNKNSFVRKRQRMPTKQLHPAPSKRKREI
jgi:hypothetical protein